MRMRTIAFTAALSMLMLVPGAGMAAPKKKRPPKKKTTDTTTTAPAEPEPPKPDQPTTDPTPAADPAKPATPPPAPATPGGGGGGAQPAEPPKKLEVPETADEPDVDSLRQEYLALRDELFKSRARASAVSSQLFSTQIQIKLTFTSARFYNPAKASIRLDGANVFDDATGKIGGDDGVRFSGYIAPGRHVITFRVEAIGKDDDSFTSVTESQIVVKAVAGKDLIVAAKAKDGGDIAYEWKRKERGSYGLGLDVSVKTVAQEGAPKKGGK